MGRRLWPVELALRFDKEEAEALWQLFEPIDAKCVTTDTTSSQPICAARSRSICG